MLPKIDRVTFTEKLPTSEEQVVFRQMTVREEKILLTCKEVDSYRVKLDAILQVLNRCIISSQTKVEDMTITDVEYLFLKIRSVSVSNISTVSFVDTEDKITRKFDINLDKLEVKSSSEKNTGLIAVNDKISIKMRYPTASMIVNDSSEGINEDLDSIIARCVVEIYDGDTIISASSVDKTEMIEWLDGAPPLVMKEIGTFFDSMPRLYYKIEYVNEIGNKRSVELTSLEDFFSWR